ncbi:MAG: alpha/beta fold hydrolase [Candidatus Methylomirabilia bacterium]
MIAITPAIEMIRVRGTPIQLMRGGVGPPLLYLHSAMSEVVWLPFHDLLARQFEVYAPAHPGFGVSEGLDRIQDMEDLVFHYLDFFDHWGWERVSLVGLSLGGWLAAELATRNPDRIDRLVLVDAAGLHLPGTPMVEIFVDNTVWPDARERLRRVCFYDPDSPIARAFIPDGEVSSDRLLLMFKAREAAARVGWDPYFYNPRLRERLHRVKAPTLILWGDSDRLIPLTHAEAYRAGIVGSQLQVFERCGHMLPLEQPEAFATAATDFLRDPEPPNSRVRPL